MARIIRFPLKMKNGAEVRSLDELKENFDLESVLGYFTDGKLQTWLADRYYAEKANAVAALSKDASDLNAKLCEILEVEYKPEADDTDLEYIQRHNEKLKKLSALTANQDILQNADIVAMNQDDLYDILDEGTNIVYLYAEKFEIPFGKKNISYIGVNEPLVIIDKTKFVFEYEEAGISFKNVRFDEAVNPYITRGELLYIENKYKEAFPLVKESAECGNPRAMYILAMSYKDGSGIGIDREKCKEWLSKANGLNEPLSMFNYAFWCCKDDNEKKMSILNRYLYEIKKLSSLGDVLAQFEYGDYLISYTNDKTTGMECLKKAASKEFAPAFRYLGNRYYYGNGVEKDYSKAFEYYRKAAEYDIAEAQNGLGFSYQNGYGITQDYAEAIKWYRKAADQGLASAQCNLGYMYENGYGISQDKIEAAKWYRKAAEQGNETAKNNLNNLNKQSDTLLDSINRAAITHTNFFGRFFK